MTEDEKYKIAVLAEALDTARRHRECCEMTNANQPTAELRTQVTVSYELAKTAELKAWADLERARQRIAGLSP